MLFSGAAMGSPFQRYVSVLCSRLSVADAWFQLVNGQVAATYPNVASPQTVSPTTGVDSFTGSRLSHLWEWYVKAILLV